MAGEIPSGALRFEPGYTFDQQAVLPEFSSDNALIGAGTRTGQLQAIFLGRCAEYQLMRKNIWIDSEGAHAIYVVGKRRSGKTYTLGVLVEGLAANGWIHQGPVRQAVVVFDTMNVFLTMPHDVTSVFSSDSPEVTELSRWSLGPERLPVRLFYPRGTTPPPEGDSQEIAIRPSDLAGEDWAALFEVDTYSDPIGQLISELHEKTALEGYVAVSGAQVSANSNYSIDDLLSCLDTSPGLAPPRYEQRTIEAVRRRLNAVRRLDIFDHQGTDPQTLFCPGRISILLLRDLDQKVRSLLAGVLVKRVLQLRSFSDRLERLASVSSAKAETLKDRDPRAAAEARARAQQYLSDASTGLSRAWIVIDEAHNYMPARGIVASSEPLKKYVNEGRNLGLSIVVATQNPSALDPAIRRNADVLIIHSISMRDDIGAVEGMINTFVPDSFQFGRSRIDSRVFEQLVRTLPQGYAVLSNDRISRVLAVRVRPRLTVHGGIEY